jgi:hypothetical protein
MEGLLFNAGQEHLTGMPTHACFLFCLRPNISPNREKSNRARIGCIFMTEIYKMGSKLDTEKTL